MFDYKTLRHGRYGGIDVLGWGTYPESSVLAGQPSKTFIDNFPDEEAARERRTEPCPTLAATLSG